MSTIEDVSALQQKWEQLSEWGAQNPEEWSKRELENNEMLLEGIEAELTLRTALPNWSLTPTNITRIQGLEETAQTVRNRIAWCKGEYEYDGGERVNIEEEERDESLLILEAETEGLDEEGGESEEAQEGRGDVEMGGA
ncbi:hypothetical protein E2P81_ATG02648 [Venturia nashicola]|uniref:Uncharacterized protein n=1 Tax=Venturia nashicola TaxID=86259 RepID=A0A4Z1PGB1_9PEZI|nr:hypothetical protein E6O75_ATG02711 [Venturia nashicola]TLD36866.1 hypothetical protein E2P81_ATG02648 [Venturia nashicola]